MRDKEAGCFHEVAGTSIVDAVVRVHSRHFNGRQPSGLGKKKYFNCGMSLLLGGGGLMCGIKIPHQEFALKMQGGGGGGGGAYA